MKNVIITILVFLVLISSGISLYFFKELNSNKIETNEKDIPTIEDKKVEEEVLDQISGKVKKTGEKEKISNQNLKPEDDLAVYKNEKYNYSFKYPKDWYLYEYSDYREKCPTKSDLFGVEKSVILSKSELKGCEIVEDGEYNSAFGGNIYFHAMDKGGMVNIVENRLSSYNEEYKEAFIGNGIRSTKSVFEGSPRYTYDFRVARFNYSIIIKKDNKENIDSELMSFLDSIVIEDYYCETDSDCVIKEEKDTCLECDKKFVCVNENSEINKVKAYCASPKNYETCITSIVPTGCQCVNNRCEDN